jgi:hypothetical protein
MEQVRPLGPLSATARVSALAHRGPGAVLGETLGGASMSLSPVAQLLACAGRGVPRPVDGVGTVQRPRIPGRPAYGRIFGALLYRNRQTVEIGADDSAH